MLSSSRVLVAGGSGFIGSNLTERLVAEGCQVRATFHQRTPAISNPAIEYVPCDLTLVEDCQRVVRGIDYVFMCAASTSGAAMIASVPLVHVTPNIVMNAQLMEAAYKAKVKKFLFISSSVAYPPSGNRPVFENEMFQGDPPEIYYASGWMKRYAEILCLTYACKLNPSMPTIVIRPSNIYGPYDKFEFATSHMVAALIRRVVERHKPIVVWGTGSDVRDVIYIDDFIDGLIDVFEKSEDYAAVNIAGGQAYSVKQILETILQEDNYINADVQFDASKPSTLPIRLIDISKAQKEFGFRPKVDLRDGIKKTLAWYRKFYGTPEESNSPLFHKN